MQPVPPTAFLRPQAEYSKLIQFQNVDAQDHYMEIHAFTDLTYSVKQSQQADAIQATPNICNRPTQTPFSSTETVGTYFEPQLLSAASLQKQLRLHPIYSFIQKQHSMLHDCLVSNQLADSEYALQSDNEQYDARGQSTLPEIQALQHAKYTKGRVVTAETACQFNNCTIIFQAVAEWNYREKEGEFYILIWNVADALSPLAVLCSTSAVSSIEVASGIKSGLIVCCGTVSGYLCIYDLDDVLRDFYSSSCINYNQKMRMPFSKSIQANYTPYIYYPSIFSPVGHFHTKPVTCVKWLPSDCQILRSGELQISANLLGGIQFCSVAPDGFLKVFSLSCIDRDQNRPDLTVLIPFLNIPCAAMFPTRALKPVSIVFPIYQEPSTNFAIGDSFGNLAFTTWPAAVAGWYALQDDRKKREKQLQRDMTSDANVQLERMQTFFQDCPTRGTFITAFKYFLGNIFKLEYSYINPNLLVAAAPDGIKMWIVEKAIHYQSEEAAWRGLSEEQLILQYDFESATTAGFVTVEYFPVVSTQFTPQSKSAFVDLSYLLAHLTLSVTSALVQASDMSSFNAADLSKRALNYPYIVVKTFENDFKNYNYYYPVFSFSPKDGSITAICLSQSRVGVLFVGTDRGQILVFDLLDRMHEPLIQAQVTVGPVTTLEYFSQAVMSGQLQVQVASQENGAFNILPEKKRSKRSDILIVGDMHGTLHILEIPSSLKQQKKRAGAQVDEAKLHEKSRLRQVFRRCLESDFYMNIRQAIKAREIEENSKREEERREKETEEHDRYEAEKSKEKAERVKK